MMTPETDPPDGILLVGPTGSGKTPLGRYLNENGFEGRACHHFDFGEELRRVACLEKPTPFFHEADLALVRSVLSEGRLLEDEDFYIAEKVFQSFKERVNFSKDELVAMNGLPRHLGQAQDVKRLVRISKVIHLHCTPETVLYRIKMNLAGDRHGREDDQAAAVKERMALFHERTAPLLDFYREAGVPVETVRITTEILPEDILALQGNCC